MPRLAALTGLDREARVLRRGLRRRGVSAEVAVGGLDRHGAAVALERMLADRPALLLSFGLAGGLDPSLAPGGLVCPRAVHAPDGTRWPVDWPGRTALAAALGAADAPVAGRDVAAGTPEAKRALWDATGAGIVDMESHLVAAAARRHGVPFLVLRAVSDPAERSVPAAFVRAIDRRGRLRMAGLPGLAAHPATLWALGRDSARALRALQRAAQALCTQLDDEPA